MEQIKFPTKIVSKLSLRLKILYLSCVVFFLLCGIGMLILFIIDNVISMLIGCLLLLSFACFCLYIIISVEMLKKHFIQFTDQEMIIHVPFKKKKVKWKDIHSAALLSNNNTLMLGLLLKEDLFKKRTLLRNANALLGADFSFVFTVGFFKDINPDMLLKTIENKIDDSGYYERLDEEYQLSEQSFLKGYASSLIVSVLISVVYAFFMVVLKMDIVVIPILGSFIIIAVFNKFYIEETSKVLVRLLMGLVCIIQVPIAIVLAEIFYNDIEFRIKNIGIVSKQCFEYMTHNFNIDKGITIIIAVICFIIGLTVRLKKIKD